MRPETYCSAESFPEPLAVSWLGSPASKWTAGTTRPLLRSSSSVDSGAAEASTDSRPENWLTSSSVETKTSQSIGPARTRSSPQKVPIAATIFGAPRSSVSVTSIGPSAPSSVPSSRLSSSSSSLYARGSPVETRESAPPAAAAAPRTPRPMTPARSRSLAAFVATSRSFACHQLPRLPSMAKAARGSSAAATSAPPTQFLGARQHDGVGAATVELAHGGGGEQREVGAVLEEGATIGTQSDPLAR